MVTGKWFLLGVSKPDMIFVLQKFLYPEKECSIQNLTFYINHGLEKVIS